MDKYPFYAGGSFGESASIMPIASPYSHEPVALACFAGPTDLEKAIVQALSSAGEMAELPSCQRFEILMHIARELHDKREHFGRTIALEAGKPLKYALAETDRAVQTFTVAAEESKRLPREYLSLDWTPAGKKREGLVRHFPIGLVAGISPFNFPLNLAVHKLAPAIAAGCPIILKPSSSTPLSTLMLARLIDRTSLPKGSVSVLPMDRKTGNLLVTDERIKMLTFTGSPDVGWKMKRNAGKKKVVLELGGNAGVIITPTTDVQDAITKCITGAFSYSGQVCIHAQRFFIHKDVFEEFCSAFVAATQKLRYGDPLDINTDVSVMIDEANAIRVEEWVTEALEQGAKILTGGRRQGSYYPPTVLTRSRNTMKVCSMEVFGPVVTLEPYEDFGEAIRRMNDTRFGLQAGVFTNDIREMDEAFARLEVGGVIINDVPTFRADHMPYGGVKDSGLGREGVKYAILDMMEPRIMVKYS
jgi:glyceraldehyde-3-phosphate dehydrogenase (NADP+)